MTKAKILVVEDERAFAKLIDNSLKHLGYVVASIVSSGKEAVRKASETYPDLVLMDIMLRGEMDGIEAAEQIRSCFKIPVVFITAHEDDEILQRAKLAKPFGYLVKPFKERELRVAIDMALAMHSIDKKLRESEERYRQLVELSPDAIIVTDLERNILIVNRQKIRIYGCEKEEEIVGKNEFELIAPEDRDRAIKNTKRTLEEGEVRNVEYILFRKDGTAYPAELNTSLINDANGKPIGFIDIVRDITERKHAEEALRESKEYARNIIKSSMDMIIAVDDNRRITEFNKAAEETFGYSREEVLGKHVNLLYADPKQGLSVNKMTIKHGRHVQEIFNRRKDGEVFPSLLASSVLVGSNGEKRGVMGISRDITEEKQTAEVLRESEERYRTLFEQSTDAIYIGTQGGKFVDANQSTLDLFGYRKEGMLSLDAQHIYANPGGWLKFQHEVEKKGAVNDYEVTLCKKDGTEIDCIVTATVRRDKDGSFIEYQSIVRDVTEAKQAYWEIERLANFPKENPSPVIEVNSEGNATYINPTGEELLRRLKLPKYKIDHILPSNHRELVNKSLKTGEDIPPQEVQLNSSVFLWAGHPLKELQLVHFHATDITKLKEKEKELIKAKQQAEMSTQLKNVFLSTMSHEIRTPLNAILGYTDLLASDQEGRLTRQGKEFIKTIQESGDRLKHLMDDILDISLIEADRTALNLEISSGDELVKKVLREIFLAAGEKNLEVVENYQASTVWIRVDKQRFQQVIGNIVQNAVKFTSKGRITVTTKLSDGEYQVAVQDTGIGISKEFKPHLFALFSQAQTGYSRPYEGVGLGLAISQRLIVAMGGRIEVESEVYKGSTFTVFLPVETVTKTEVGKEVVETEPLEQSLPPREEEVKKRTVLILEDNQANLNYIEYVVAKLGLSSLLAKSGEKALELLSDRSSDCMLIDISLGIGMSGIEFMKRVKKMKRFKNVPMIAVTAHTMKGQREVLLREGFDDYLAKPFNYKDLKKVMVRNGTLAGRLTVMTHMSKLYPFRSRWTDLRQN